MIAAPPTTTIPRAIRGPVVPWRAPAAPQPKQTPSGR